MAKIIKWFEEAEATGFIEKYIEKFDSRTLDEVNDSILFYGAIAEAYLLSGKSDDEEKQELAEIINDDIEEYGSIAFHIEGRGYDEKALFVMTKDEKKIAMWTGEYEPLPNIKNNVLMEMTPACNKKIIYGDPNTDAEFFAGALTVKGPLKLAVKPRGWIEAFFEFIEREPLDFDEI